MSPRKRASGMTDRQLAVRSGQIALAALTLALYCIAGHPVV